MSQPTPDSLKALDARIAELRAQGKDVSALEQKRAEAAQTLGVDNGANVGVIDPQNKSQAEAAQSGRDWANDPIGKVKDMFGGIFGGGDDDDGATDENGESKGKKGKFKWGNTIAGVLGVGIAYLLSSIFGGGMLGTIMFALFAIPAFMMGRSQLGGSLSKLFGETPSPDSPAKSNEVQLAQNQSVSGMANGVATNAPQVPQVPQQPTPQQQLAAEVLEVAQKSQVARAAIIQQAQTGEINPRRAQSLMTQVGRAEMMVQQMQGVDINRLGPDQMRAINREFGMAEAALDRAINTNPIIGAQVQQNMAPVAFAGVPQNTIGANLTPQAQMQVQSVRESGQYYQYQPAQQGVVSAQRFSGVPDQQPFMLPDAYIPR